MFKSVVALDSLTHFWTTREEMTNRKRHVSFYFYKIAELEYVMVPERGQIGRSVLEFWFCFPVRRFGKRSSFVNGARQRR
jgi:hypothetical protein